ncbi:MULTISPECIES: SDR family oxidoreductase [Chryseobacterium]|uniref:NAD(P)-dependent dehydrogenase (Short-subunit alcohol dehydrogenase family) n=1 Tax=Chryseobacterium camelliae TaxID=1265445 RepID=A0ABU0THN7_9FLAO|nr:MULTISPECIES: SDR family oxidoreductase [Chryseobacterium]MDT3405847.1 NAD(P)-dependent dehydrogenase (short-subunit alcohol dehydrogenase family) [Pseudacidovorax intermedius]MDQ1096346.1 NAD(P)-dependent dehydrogenase (short-subunit alcohol dehydrogenase family) [Chryseobacterium camelliae]MDQ1100285.1 NAD(P)-dependent dehydrogenase (short-subunit alcohol dehydrogenase family) [Chryseobacterium sp. SORGH_AS_1048]MDR6087628.1 NAD(P)-dependent dehydrogenase (short-subunit alcohol dehydrogena
MLENKVAYITGGTKGIGFGVAKTLLENGVSVAFSGRKKEDVLKAEEELKQYSGSVLGIVSDVRSLESEQQAIDAVKEKFGRLDFVIANAGLGIFKPVDQLTAEEWNDMIGTNLTGVFYTLKAAVEELKKSEGYYITIASLAGANFFENGTGYNASKFGVVGFTQAAMIDLRKYNIKSTVIMPGSVATHFNGNIPSEKDSWKIQPEDMGNLILDILKMNPRVLPSKVEFRATKPA